MTPEQISNLADIAWIISMFISLIGLLVVAWNTISIKQTVKSIQSTTETLEQEVNGIKTSIGRDMINSKIDNSVGRGWDWWGIAMTHNIVFPPWAKKATFTRWGVVETIDIEY